MKYQDTIFFQLSRASRILTRQVSEIVHPATLEASSFFLLCSLAEFPCYGLTGLASELGMERTSLSRGFQLLVKKGYAKTKSGLDKRYATFSITSDGQEIVDKYLPLVDNLHKKAIRNGLSTVYDKLKGCEIWKT